MPKKSNRPQRAPRRILHIFCEGESEENYINGYKNGRCLGKQTVIVETTDKNTPKQLVNEAVKMKRDGGRSMKGDSFWVVYDRESKQKYPDRLHAEARNKAEGKRYKNRSLMFASRFGSYCTSKRAALRFNVATNY